MVRLLGIVAFSLCCGGLLAATPPDRSKLNREGYLALRDMEFEKAKGTFQRARNLAELLKQRDLCYAHSLNGLATAEQRLGDYHSAVELFEESLGVKALFLETTDPDYASTSLNLALVYQQQGRLLHAYKIIQDLLDLKAYGNSEENVNVAQAKYSLGTIDLALGNLDPAEQELRFAQRTLGKLQPKSPLLFPVRQALAQLKRDRGELASAQDDLYNLIREPLPDEKYALVSLDLALVQAAQGDLDGSIASGNNVRTYFRAPPATDPRTSTFIHADRAVAMLNAAKLALLAAPANEFYKGEIPKFEEIARQHEVQRIAHLEEFKKHLQLVKDHSELTAKLRLDPKQSAAVKAHEAEIEFHTQSYESHQHQSEFHEHQVKVQLNGKAAFEKLIAGEGTAAETFLTLADIERMKGDIHLKQMTQHAMKAANVKKPAPDPQLHRIELKVIDHEIAILREQIAIRVLHLDKLKVQTRIPTTYQEQLKIQIDLACREVHQSHSPTDVEIAEIDAAAKVALENARRAVQISQLTTAERTFAKAGLLFEKAHGMRSQPVMDCFQQRRDVLLRLAEAKAQPGHSANPAMHAWRAKVCDLMIQVIDPAHLASDDKDSVLGRTMVRNSTSLNHVR